MFPLLSRDLPRIDFTEINSQGNLLKIGFAERDTGVGKENNYASALEVQVLFFLNQAVRAENGGWRRSNSELYRSYKESDIVNFIKIQRIKWAGHVIRMNEDRTTKKVFNTRPIGTRRKGRPNLRWIDDLEKDLLVLRARNWRTLAGRRQAWKRLLEKVKAHPRLSCH
ncbi:uncharacterized protein TNCV_2198821 [Trichonephila clavipes]|nr:uncharacterized protein TNCV_2198821 [Trichonephila clavipes]